jgi:DNA-binding LytR/AlgR family response regulator
MRDSDSDRFIRIHRSIIVARDRIVAVWVRSSGGYSVELTSGVLSRASRTYGEVIRNIVRGQ